MHAASFGVGGLVLYLASVVDAPFESFLVPMLMVGIFAGGALVLAGSYLARDHVSREISADPGTYLESVRAAHSFDMFILVWKDVLVPGHRKKERLGDGKST